MEARRRRLEELDITRDEINNIGQALQNEDFRKLFVEYCEEVNSPESKKQYQKEVKELEQQRGVDVTFINPEPGFVIKTSVDGQQKAFVNVSKNENVSKPSSSPAASGGSHGRQWSLPFSLAPPREDLDKQRKRCTVYDVVFHPYTLLFAEKSPEFRQMLIDTALDAVENNCNVKLDRQNLKFPNIKFKGLQQAAVIRKKIPNHKTDDGDDFLKQIPYPPEDQTWSHVNKSFQKEQKSKDASSIPGYTAPKYIIKYRYGIDLADFTEDSTSRVNSNVPKELVVEIDLPLLKSAADVTLDVTSKSLVLACEKPKYKLDLILPYGVDEDAGNATFDKALRKLTLILPVKSRASALTDVGREDSGVESDPGSRPEDDCDDKTPSENSDVGSEGSDHARSEGSDHAHVEELVSVINDDAYRTSHDYARDCDSFFKKDVQYILPSFTSNSFENVVALTLHVKNVEQNSVRQRVICEGRGVQFIFTSLGGGMFPVNYGLCVVFPEGVRLEVESIHVEVWDNNVVAQVSLAECSTSLPEMLVGTGLHDLKTHPFPDLLHIENVLSDLQLDAEKSTLQPAMVEVCNAQPDKLVLCITPTLNIAKTEESTDSTTAKNSDDNHKHTSLKEAELSEGNTEATTERSRRKTMRQMSECCDEMNSTKIRGILKKRATRSLSESNADEYAWFHGSMSLSDGMESGPGSAIGSELCIAEEGCETGCETEYEGSEKQCKKTVRFCEVVAQKTFRPNSSILGQRKKNQRKQRNKKRAQERRLSESENSEVESERRRTCHSEGEASDLEDKTWKNSKEKFLKEQKTQVLQPKVAAILKRTSSSDTDEEGIKYDGSVVPKSQSVVNVVATQVESEIPEEESSPSTAHGESSEEERDHKTDENKKKKKRRKGKKMGSCENQSKFPTGKEQNQFHSHLLLDLEI